MPLSSREWHQRYLQQARWTRDLREYLYKRAGLENARRVLDVGCGTGALLGELQKKAGSNPYGLDIDSERLALAAKNQPTARLTQCDASNLPYVAGHFDLVLCHFLLLWLGNPEQAVAEMRRVTRSGGSVLALAEPDYGGRIDYPEYLEVLGDWQRSALQEQGADHQIGRRLREMFNRSGLKLIEAGVLGGQWRARPTRQEWELEWIVLLSDLQVVSTPGTAGLNPLYRDPRNNLEIEPEKIEELRALDWTAWERGERILFVPTFYAWGQVIAS